MKFVSVISSFSAFVAAFMCYVGRIEMPAVISRISIVSEHHIAAGVFALLGLWLMTRVT